MFLSDLSIKRPVFAAVMMLMLVTLGIFSFRRLPLDLYPNVEIPILIVKTQFPGASPEAVEREVTKKIEEAVNPIAGVKHVISYSIEGMSQVVVQFDLDVKINEASQEAQAKIATIRGELPEAMEEPVIQKLDFSAMPIVSVAIKSSTLSPRDLSTFVERKVKPKLENLSGVGKVDLVGLSKREISVEPDPARLDALHMGVDELIAGLTAENTNTPLGRLKSGPTEAPLRISGKPEEVSGFDRMVVTNRNGRPVRLGEVAKVTDSIEERRSMAFIAGISAIGVDIQKQSGANTVEVVDAVQKSLAKIKAELPPGVEAVVVRDGSVFIKEAVEDVENSLVLGGLLTVFIVFCFLNSWRSTVITGLTLPISVIASFIVMNFMGMTLNVMTLMALSLAIGLLIDDAIVVRENIVRHLEMGKDHFTAAREGTAEIGLAVLATTFSIVAVFVPVAFMKGIVGRFFFSFGITVTFAVLVSLFVSFTLDPMLSSRWHDPDIERSGKRHLVARILDRFNDWFDRLADVYRHMINWALGHRKTVVLAAILAFVGGIMVFGTLESSFMVNYDRGEFQVNIKTAPDASIDETNNRMTLAMETIASLPEVERFYGTIGANDTTVRDASIYVKLKEKKDRSKSQDEVSAVLREKLSKIPGMTHSLAEAGGFHGEKALQANLRGDDIEKLKHYSQLLKAEIYKIPGIVDLEATMEYDIPEYRMKVDRDRIADAGLNSGSIVRTVGSLVGGHVATTFEDETGDAVNVRVRLPEELRADVEGVRKLKLNTPPRGQPAAAGLSPIGEFVSYEMAKTPSVINRQDLTRQVVISANLAGLPIGTAVEKVKEAAKNVPMEPGYRLVFSGEAEDMAESFMYMAEALLLAVLFVYLILAAQFESFIDPLSIMLSLPLSLVGMAGMLRLTNDTISIMSLIGLIMLMGLVTKNAILLIDYAKILRKEGMERREALVLAGRTRLRPILMTTAAMIFGMLPLALAIGAGSEMRAPMARAVIGGLITSTLLTLLVVPVVYSILDDLGAWVKRRWKGKHAAPAAALLICALLLPALSRAEGKSVTLDEARKIAAARNKDIQQALQYTEQAKGRYVEERAAALPSVTVNGSWMRQDNASQAALTRSKGSSVMNASSVDITLNQAIYTWGKVEAAIRAAKEGLATGDDRVRTARQGAYLNVTQAFYDVLLAREMESLYLETLLVREKHWEEAKKKQAAGVATEFDVLSAKVALENARPDSITAANRLRMAKDLLGTALGGDEGEVDAIGSLEVSLAVLPEYGRAVETALKNRPELSELNHTLGVYDELVTIAKAGDKPNVAFVGQVARRDYDPDGAKSVGGNDWSAGVVATWPIFDGLATKGRHSQALAEAESLRLEKRKLEDAIRLSVRNSINAATEATEVVLALSTTVAQAQKAFDMAQKGYEFGVMTRLEVDDALLNLTRARLGLTKAKRDYLVARATLEASMGVIGER